MDNRSAVAVQYRRVGEASAGQHRIMPDDTFLMFEVSRAARLYISFQAAAVRLEGARTARASRKGRRPGDALIDRLEHRMLTASAAYSAAIASLAAAVPRPNLELERAFERGRVEREARERENKPKA